jgi:RNA polymerase sigma factor (sigma-70 family)
MTSGAPSSSWTDQQIVDACLAGDDRAWDLLIGRYKNLICSFPRRYGARGDDAADVFQLVCVELFLSLPRLRDQRSLRAWITTIARHQAYHWKRRQVKRRHREGEELDVTSAAVPARSSSDLEFRDRAQVVRRAVARLSPRNRELVRLLFYSDPPATYEAVATKLGLATGSISLTRVRCLRKLAKLLEEPATRHEGQDA